MRKRVQLDVVLRKSKQMTAIFSEAAFLLSFLILFKKSSNTGFSNDNNAKEVTIHN